MFTEKTPVSQVRFIRNETHARRLLLMLSRYYNSKLDTGTKQTNEKM